MKTSITPVSQGSRIYNAVDAPGHFRGMGVEKGVKKRGTKPLIYSVYRISGGFAHCESWDILGKHYDERIPIGNLVAYGPEKR